ncbi:hypothetical protein O6P43_029929 [Quillaja saponaria]|uniref:Uncharacterized protein n=1 Tax=Quillaja saponaria TaxID=32244 RepID=A0AAD7L108_QUISA|nr:hypothetical protein O6P43_029929 [Quillaja saponaria]
MHKVLKIIFQLNWLKKNIYIPDAARIKPSTRMTAPSPNQVRRKALSFLLCSLTLPLSSSETKAGFSTGDRRIIEALSLLLLPFLLPVAVLASDLEDDDDPNPCPDELSFFNGASAEMVSSTLVVGFDDSEGCWDLTVRWVLGEE